LISDAMVYKVLMDTDSNRAKGVLYIDRNTQKAKEVFGRVVILCAQAQESVRVLLNSANSQYPNGLANSSGVLGRYLTAHIRSGGGGGELPLFGAKPSLNGPDRPVSGVYVARFRNLKNGPKSKNFLRGYGFEGGSTGKVNFNFSAPGFGEAYKKAVKESTAS
jgi:choline dehydrogenase-like flavoprotein